MYFETCFREITHGDIFTDSKHFTLELGISRKAWVQKVDGWWGALEQY